MLICIGAYSTRNIVLVAQKEKEVIEIKKPKTQTRNAEFDKSNLLIKTLLYKVEKEQELESDLNSTDGIVDTLARLAERLLTIFREKLKNSVFRRVQRLH